MALNFHGNAFVALAAAASWGGGDFSGGVGVKAAGGTTAGALRLVIVAHAVSLAVLLILLNFHPGPRPSGILLAWGLSAGVAAAISLTAFYIALSRGAMGASAAISGLLAAMIPAVVSSVIEGAPTPLRIVGFVLAAAAIWMIAAGPNPDNVETAHQRKTMLLAIIGGLGFGFYFVALRMDNPLGELEPMALTRTSSLICCVVMLLVLELQTRRTQSSQRNTAGFSLSRAAVVCALGVALLDTGGNMLFLTATRMGRLDVAAVLASLYPAGTILLAAWQLHERPTRRQLAGMGVALAAVVMITV